MHAEQFDVRRIRDGVTYNTKASELLAYAEGYGEDRGGRWRAGLFRTPAGGFFAVREEAGRHFDQISGRWQDNTSISLDVLDRPASVAWCERHDANVLVDFVGNPDEEISRETEDAAPGEAASEGLLLQVSDEQREAIEIAAQKANLAVDDYVLRCLEARGVAADAASDAGESAEAPEASEPAPEADAAATDEAEDGEAESVAGLAEEVVVETPVADEAAEPAEGDDEPAADASVGEVIPAAAAAESQAGEAAEEAVSEPEGQPVADGVEESDILVVVEKSEADPAGSDAVDLAAVAPLAEDIARKHGVGLNGLGAEEASVGQAAE